MLCARITQRAALLQHFWKLQIPWIMRKILKMVGASLSQFGPTFYPYLQLIINICWAISVPSSMKIFFFMKLKRMPNKPDRMRIGRRDQQHACVAHPPLELCLLEPRVLFMQSSFLLGSRETWVLWDEFSFDVSLALNHVKTSYADKVSKTSIDTGFGKGVPLVLSRGKTSLLKVCEIFHRF